MRETACEIRQQHARNSIGRQVTRNGQTTCALTEPTSRESQRESRINIHVTRGQELENLNGVDEDWDGWRTSTVHEVRTQSTGPWPWTGISGAFPRIEKSQRKMRSQRETLAELSTETLRKREIRRAQVEHWLEALIKDGSDSNEKSLFGTIANSGDGGLGSNSLNHQHLVRKHFCLPKSVRYIEYAYDCKNPLNLANARNSEALMFLSTGHLWSSQ